MKVFKFGGASVNSVERIRNLGDVLRLYPEEKILVIISAMGKTTNALEEVVQTFYAGKNEEALRLFEKIKQDHLATTRELLGSGCPACEKQLKDFFTEAEWLLHDRPQRSFDYYYDQVVCTGELLSTAIISAWLNESGMTNQWLDVRDIFRTDDDFRDATVNWDDTRTRVDNIVLPLFSQTDMIITQGFIGATGENESTTLGREGSDYSGAVFANMLEAEYQAIWKDVESVMNADPKQFPDAVPIPALDYNEVIEMAYYGAQVIHPKTIKPLQNKNIPLHVKCFLQPRLPGTVIHDKPVHHLPPIIVVKENQIMMRMSVRDFSFVGEQLVGHLYQLFEKLHIKPNLTQNGAISFVSVLDDRAERMDTLAHEAAAFFDVEVSRGLTLLTIRHYNDAIVDKLVNGRKVWLKQQTPETVQLLLES